MLSKTMKGDPIRIGHVVVVPPGMRMPELEGFTAFWEEELGLLYVSNKDATKVNLSIGRSIRFELSVAVTPGRKRLCIAYGISNV